MSSSAGGTLGPLLLLLAMGNWINTPSPALDSNAPAPQGNDGQLQLELDGGQTYLLHSATLGEGALLLTGETVGDSPTFVLRAELPDADSSPPAWRGQTLKLRSGTVGERRFPGGSLSVISVTGQGPWELDAEVVLSGSEGDSFSGQLQARLRPTTP
jgi:hypothetical protein